jgi:polyhydroxybutyrate depolymerase
MLRVALFLVFLLSPLALSRANNVDAVTDFNTFLTPGRHDGTMPLDDHDRRFIIVTPDGASLDHPAPIVFFFHGAGGSAEQAARTYGWVEKAKAEHFFVVFPDGLGVRPDEPGSFLLNPRIWRDERGTIPGIVQDVDFFSSLLDKLEAVLPIDKRRVYVTGFSNGAGMTFTLGGHFSDRIAAIAPVASQSFVAVDHLARPLPVYYIVGTADPLIPFNGGSSAMPWGKSRTFPPVQESADLWAKLDGCPAMAQTLSDRNGVRVLRYGPGQSGSEVIYTIVDGNGHHWPGSVEPLPQIISGPRLDPFSATDCIWDFFRHHPLPTDPST